ncbi:hypothetical protein BMF16_07955 [Staphylococcus aureus]|nr:hypothetical protein BMF16_07955 [Staphylococcus aureus]ONH12057.1 hypothetical protein BMF31_13950 [Staphylococcus aureus]ONH19636.1 hypothetical protein BMF23_08330 [Staphylococcus aureus]
MIKSKFSELVYSAFIVLITIMLKTIFNIEIKWLSEVITLIIFSILFVGLKKLKRFFNPFNLEIDLYNKSNDQKPDETNIIIKDGIKNHTTEKMRSVTLNINIEFNNTISKALIRRMVNKNLVFLRVQIDSEELKFSTNKVNKDLKVPNRKDYFYDCTYKLKNLSESNHNELVISETVDLIVEYIGIDMPNDTKNNIHLSLMIPNGKGINIILLKIFQTMIVRRNHKIYVSKLKE